jgi:hypothetical protein
MTEKYARGYVHGFNVYVQILDRNQIGLFAHISLTFPTF